MVAVAAAACAGPDAAPIDAPPRDAPPPCDTQSLTIGRCVTDAGVACTGALGEVRRFEAAAAGAEVPLVVGPQGSAMLVFAVATTGIIPGDPDDPTAAANPQLELVVARGGAELALYRGRMGFSDQDGLQVSAGLFAITEDTGLDGVALMAHAVLTDQAGALRCGDWSFVARR
ncbi:MAG: hypothetical protein IPL61_35260 [Myxococcales bacterium]|nr:hypothetical protein [Myxococcales bacterium]